MLFQNSLHDTLALIWSIWPQSNNGDGDDYNNDKDSNTHKENNNDDDDNNKDEEEEQILFIHKEMVFKTMIVIF